MYYLRGPAIPRLNPENEPLFLPCEWHVNCEQLAREGYGHENKHFEADAGDSWVRPDHPSASSAPATRVVSDGNPRPRPIRRPAETKAQHPNPNAGVLGSSTSGEDHSPQGRSYADGHRSRRLNPCLDLRHCPAPVVRKRRRSLYKL